jgi:hypothetical protein
MRLSNFLLWQISYAELYVTDVCWPDFRREQLMDALRAYARRERRFGGLEAPDDLGAPGAANKASGKPAVDSSRSEA